VVFGGLRYWTRHTGKGHRRLVAGPGSHHGTNSSGGGSLLLLLHEIDKGGFSALGTGSSEKESYQVLIGREARYAGRAQLRSTTKARETRHVLATRLNTEQVSESEVIRRLEGEIVAQYISACENGER